MPYTSTKHKLRAVAGSDSLAIATALQNLANDVDNKMPHRGLPYFGKPYIESGAALTNPAGLNVAVAQGTANILGVTFDFAASGNLLCTANVANRIWLTATFDVNGFITGYVWSVRTDTTVPANSVLVGYVDAAAATLTRWIPTFRGVIAPGALINKELRTTTYGASLGASGYGASLFTGFELIGDGVTPVKIETYHPSVDANTAGQTGGVVMRDSVAVADLGAGFYTAPGVNYRIPCKAESILAPHLTRKFLQSSLFNLTSTIIWNLQGNSPSNPGFLAARWDF